MGLAAERSGPVSYTHLDVYKRQILATWYFRTTTKNPMKTAAMVKNGPDATE